MSQTATLSRPTTRDEDWRYADSAWLAEADPAALARWADIAVADGEESVETRRVAPGVERLRVHVGAGARFALFAINAADAYARLEVAVTLGEGAHFEFGGVTIGGGKAHQEFVTRTIHAEPGAMSNQVVRSVQWGRSTGNFLGRIEVARDAQKTDAAQNFRALLLEKGASANTKPELEIFADDVQCAHGAAIGQMDEMAAYYMASRGIPPGLARRLLVQAFVGDAFVAFADEEARGKMMDEVLARLEESGL